VADKIRKAVRKKQLKKQKQLSLLVDDALAANIISESEAKLIRDAEAARDDAIQVDHFTFEEFLKGPSHDVENISEGRNEDVSNLKTAGLSK